MAGFANTGYRFHTEHERHREAGAFSRRSGARTRWVSIHQCEDSKCVLIAHQDQGTMKLGVLHTY